MSYKIAVATSDEINVDLTFGAVSEFTVYEAASGEYHKSETRKYISSENPENPSGSCSGGCPGGNGGRCGGGSEHTEKIRLISDCRAVVCTKIGMHAQKQLMLKAISAFDVQCTVKEALDKITAYYKKTDKD